MAEAYINAFRSAAKLAGKVRLGAKSNQLSTILNKFETGGQYSFLGVRGGALVPSIIVGIGDSHFIEYGSVEAFVIGSNAPTLRNIIKCRLISSVLQDNAGITYTGTWSKNLPSGGGYRGYYSRTDTVGSYVQWTSPSSSVIHAWSLLAASNGGMVLVEIDGDKTKANLLPTAQELVDSELLLNTALIENGGTLNPTDRIWNQYLNPLEFGGKTLADNLTEESHSVKLTCTGYKDVSSSGVRLYSSGFGYWSEAITPESSELFLFREETLSNYQSIWEFAHNYKPDSGTIYEWMGHSDSIKLTEAEKYYVDNVEVAAPARDHFVGGDSVKIEFKNNAVNHPEINNVARMDMAWKGEAINGLVAEFSITWLQQGLISVGYNAMFPLAETAADKASNAESSVDVILNNNDDSVLVNEKSKLAYMWDSSGNMGYAMYVPDLLSSANNYNDCENNFMWVQDRSDGDINKIYCNRVDKTSGVAVAVNDTFSGKTYYKVKEFANGADNELAR